ncbi:hypothetical protein [Hyalangium rubrum]|uniref:DUF3108 domain-containing protein n=1 Tax=Hyalangium rubrum TaxID=3103134 RepID=A0ABU5H9I2_9BACT|nr:hypothetical protein [Hyalangium sp. s54d21]MDY7229777.1 hypothetical protein [Hyalangium sp. s54d21]
MAVAEAPCPNPYFPLENGLKLTYRAGRSSELTLSTQGVTAVPEGVKGLLAVELKGKRGETEAFCTSEGVRTGLGGLEGTLLSASGMQVEVVSSEGVVVPPSVNMVPGSVWRNSLSVKMQPPESAKMPGMVIATTFDKEATVVGEEEVTVGAGTFKAVKVKNTTTARASRPGAKGRQIDSFIWFAPGVGIIKVSTGDSTDLELLKVDRPVAAQKAPVANKKATKKL